MKEVELIFPDVSTLSDFIVKQQVNNADVNSHEQMLTALMPDDQIMLAETIYGAVLKKIYPKN